MLEEPLGRTFGAYGVHDPIFTAPRFARPAVDVSEDGDNYVVETELPGVKREDMEVRVGDGGRSVTIEGKIIHGNGSTNSISGTEGTMEGGHRMLRIREMRWC
jgi:HSP20 family protein